MRRKMRFRPVSGNGTPTHPLPVDSVKDVAAPTVPELSVVLEMSEGLEAFKQHLVAEFSVENILFWTEVREFASHHKGGPDYTDGGQTLHQRAQEIISTYVLPTAEMQVNLPDKVAQQLASKPIEEYESLMFKPAEEEIYNLMKQDSYPRFIESKAGRALLSTVGSMPQTARL